MQETITILVLLAELVALYIVFKLAWKAVFKFRDWLKTGRYLK